MKSHPLNSFTRFLAPDNLYFYYDTYTYLDKGGKKMSNSIKLTHLSTKAGWGCKIGPEDLAQVLRHLPESDHDPNVLVGLDQPDDGSVYQLSEELALVQSVDFFTPIVDDPYAFGQIAAANALSDIYAMGGQPKTVLNIVAYPIKTLGPKVLAEILQGSSDQVKKAGAQVVGGHSIDDAEPKFGLAVTGVVHPKKFHTIKGAMPGEVLVLTKPIGTGILTTALKQDLLSQAQIQELTHTMCTLNKDAAESLSTFHPSAVTDITGFGLLGHAFEMAEASDVSLMINKANVPLLNGTKTFAKKGVFPGGARANKTWLQSSIIFDKNISKTDRLILCDAITSGGLLISLPEEEANEYIHELKHASTEIKPAIIGKVLPRKEKRLYVVDDKQSLWRFLKYPLEYQ